MAQRFLIVGTQRTGSQALFNAFNLHPDVVCGGEWTQSVPWFRKVATAERALSGRFDDLVAHRPRDKRRIAEAFSDSTRLLGFKVLFRSSDKWVVHPRLSPALLLDQLEGHLAWLSRNRDIFIIQLVRRDGIEWLKSKYLSRASGKFTGASYPEEMKVSIPIHRAVRALTAKNWVDSRLASLSSTNRYYRVVYEDFLADNRHVLASCLEFMGCDQARLPSESHFLQRQSTRTAAEYIRNYEELTSKLDKKGLRVSVFAN